MCVHQPASSHLKLPHDARQPIPAMAEAGDDDAREPPFSNAIEPSRVKEGTDTTVILTTRDGVRVTISLTSEYDVIVVAAPSNETSSTRSKKTDAATLAAARWLMPNVPAALIAETLGLSQGRDHAVNGGDAG
ncbi:hypothetical protein [Streptomyces marincola]|uniref:hypothetical protein n=1 Tax=Streptomyces marincola TaxID=2878388 RepID=UPI001CF29B8C|nr:hypothetical protein [Streptomyces marincola]UCM87981.1 hypothetical protein LC193_08440 [Streptomyces marincola]